MKRVWITSLVRDETRVSEAMGKLKSYGLDTGGHFWVDDLKKLAWYGARDEVIGADVWVIIADGESLAVDSVRYGLSALALAVAEQKNLPILFVAPAGDSLDLPTPFAHAEVLGEGSSWPVKVVARANVPAKKAARPYRLDVFGDAQVGQWFEVGPAEGEWPGVLFGVADAEIDQHAVGAQRKLPERCTVEYAQKGIKLTLGDQEFTAWAVRNTLTPESSYFLRVIGTPKAIVFAPMGDDDGLDAFVIGMR